MFDNRGRELRPQISRFRETGSQLIEYNQGDIVRGDLLNNTLATRKRHYSTGNKHENQKMTQETALIRAVQAKNKSSISEARKKLDIKILTLEEAIEFINNDELVEITPDDIRVRKKYLTMLERRRHARELGKLDDEDDSE